METVNTKTIKIKYHSDIDKIQPISIGNWVDLRIDSDVMLMKGESAILSLGVSMKLPKGFEAHIAPRSSTFKNWGIIQTNGIGIVDDSYSGNDDIWKMGVYATRDTYIEKNSRVCQFRIMEIQPDLVFDEVDSLDDVSRGGFGSTGVK
ncbi:MAG: deoxyuridine 5'-triphosphate nucleotidohydrolase [Thermoplasmata archaeon]|nr:deoxyuridine 5'-triphosphate nucleotidohydrolase [Thermoplasmata archaeon]